MKLSAKQLGRRYERAGRPFWALRHADLSVGAGDFVTVLGLSLIHISEPTRPG